MSNNSSGGIGFFGLLTVLFIGLKLTEYIDWSWLWVLSPIWLPITCVIIIALILGLLYLIAKVILYLIKEGLNLIKRSLK